MIRNLWQLMSCSILFDNLKLQISKIGLQLPNYNYVLLAKYARPGDVERIQTVKTTLVRVTMDGGILEFLKPTKYNYRVLRAKFRFIQQIVT